MEAGDGSARMWWTSTRWESNGIPSISSEGRHTSEIHVPLPELFNTAYMGKYLTHATGGRRRATRTQAHRNEARGVDGCGVHRVAKVVTGGWVGGAVEG